MMNFICPWTFHLGKYKIKSISFQTHDQLCRLLDLKETK